MLLFADLDPAYWGQTASWVSALLSFGAICVALFVMPRRARRADEVAQANRFVVFPAGELTVAGDRGDPNAPAVVNITMQNQGDGPVYNVQVKAVGWPSGPIEDGPVWERSVLAPGETVKSAHGWDRSVVQPSLADGDRPLLILEVTFTDASGQRWQRRGSSAARRVH